MKTLEQQLQDIAGQDPYRIPVQYLRCLKGVDTLTALTLVVEVQDFKRFPTARGFMSYIGVVSSEWSSGSSIRRGSITKVGNSHIRRVLVEASWSYHRKNVTSGKLITRRKGCPLEIIRIAKRAQDRLHRKFWRMQHHRKRSQVTVVAVARELAGFIWAVAQHFPKTAQA